MSHVYLPSEILVVGFGACHGRILTDDPLVRIVELQAAAFGTNTSQKRNTPPIHAAVDQIDVNLVQPRQLCSCGLVLLLLFARFDRGGQQREHIGVLDLLIRLDRLRGKLGDDIGAVGHQQHGALDLGDKFSGLLVQDGVGLRTKARVSSDVDEAITPIAAKSNNVSDERSSSAAACYLVGGRLLS